MTEHDDTSGPHDNHGESNDGLYSQVCTLVHKCLSGEALPTEVEELERMVCDDPQARAIYVSLMHETRALRRWAVADAGSAVDTTQIADTTLARRASEGASPTRSVSEESTPHAPREEAHHAERDGYYGRRYVSYAAAAVLLLATGIVAYTLWPRQPAQPVAVKPVVDSAATLVSATDAQWLGPFRPQDNSIAPGQRLVLERGSAAITFSRQARVILQSPADVVIVDGGACRLASGKLAAHVPTQAKGFQVHTPDGTVTDLGTEFGVYVITGPEIEEPLGEQEQPATGGAQQGGKQAPITEVHVFTGKVELAQQTPTLPKSEIQNLKSQILYAGQAVTISDNKVQPLPAADPFKFALDKLQGKPRQVLLSDDFETYELGHQVQSIGPWIVQSGIRKGQGVSVIDPVQKIAQSNAEGFTPIAPPPSLVGRRVAYIAASAPNPPHTFPLLAREIDDRLLAQNCQVLLEFDVFLHGVGFQHSLALAKEIGQTEGIELWRGTDVAKHGADAAKPSADAAKTVDVAGLNWYRLRVLFDVANGAPRDVHVERSHWRGPEGWVRDLSFQPPLPKLDWSTPPRYVIFGYPVVTPSTPAGVLWIDNVRMEVISDK